MTRGIEINISHENVMKLKPAFELNQVIEIRTMGITLPVKILRRLAKVNIDTSEVKYYYDLKHDYTGTKIKEEDIWSWPELSEEDINELMWESKRHRENENK